MSTFNYSSKNS